MRLKGKEYAVYNPSGKLVGSFDGEVIYIQGKPLYNVEGDTVYAFGVPGDFIGNITVNAIKTINGLVLYNLES